MKLGDCVAKPYLAEWEGGWARHVWAESEEKNQSCTEKHVPKEILSLYSSQNTSCLCLADYAQPSDSDTRGLETWWNHYLKPRWGENCHMNTSQIRQDKTLQFHFYSKITEHISSLQFVTTSSWIIVLWCFYTTFQREAAIFTPWHIWLLQLPLNF